MPITARRKLPPQQSKLGVPKLVKVAAVVMDSLGCGKSFFPRNSATKD